MDSKSLASRSGHGSPGWDSLPILEASDLFRRSWPEGKAGTRHCTVRVPCWLPQKLLCTFFPDEDSKALET